MKNLKTWAYRYKTPEGIPTLEGVMKMGRNDMLLTGVKGEIYPCKRDIFEATYGVLGGSAMTFGQAMEAHRAHRLEWQRHVRLSAAGCELSGSDQRGEGPLRRRRDGPLNAYLAIKNVDETVSTCAPGVNDCLAGGWGVVG